MCSGQNQNSWRFLPVRFRGVFRSKPKFVAVFSSADARCYSVRTETPGNSNQFVCEAFFSQNRNSYHYSPVYIRGVLRTGPKFLAVFPSLNARRLSVRTKAPGSIYQFACEVFLSENQSSWRYFPVLMRGVSRSEPKYLAMFSSLHARRFSVGIKIPGDIYQFGCEVVVGQNQNPRQYLPI